MHPSLLLSQLALYFPGTFMCYPWKPFINFAVGDSFQIAYAHFRRDHATPLNLALHSVCLVGQLVANFGILGALDSFFFASPVIVQGWSIRPIAAATAALWAGTLLTCPVAFLVRVASAAAVAAAYFVAPLIKPFDGVEKVLLGIFGVICIVNLLARPSKRTFKNTTSLFAKAFGGFFFAQWLATRYLADVAAPQSLEFWAICGVVGVLMAVAAGSREPAKLTAFGGAFGAHAAAWATGQPLLYFYSLAFLFQLSQGVSHRISGEQATLLQLNDSTNKKVVSHEQDRRRLGFEWAHVVYFPALLMQSLNQSTLGI